MIREQPENEYPSLPYRDNVVVWQLGEFHEERAVHDLNRILTFNPEATTGEPLRRTRHSLLAMAKEALSKIGPGGNAPASGTGRPN